ncbi:DUF2975 domain-containing protein [Aquimarina sp. 2201CG5-10]|uniref:DUF2975 domain-containing protein n=1 Tax=Aquimarina callyspongiae TaxID=3098150 RepID=UPI002AB409D2|nr:DUF2975 domain-containing protein [Aquimarina sp. 2201CG5-10]MDY8135072.1 DUF2975 domain-containing protein [Aquimarina sp. 2201CG5-10]
MQLKMFGKKSLSTILFYSTRLITIGYGIFLILIIISLISNNFIITETNDIQIKIPFTNSVIKGDYSLKTLIGILCFLIFYASFFYTLSLIFKTFGAEKLFTEEAIKYLKRFTILNLILPVAYILIGAIINSSITPDDVVPGLLHIGLGIFSWFIAAIFTLGFTIQEENELTI